MLGWETASFCLSENSLVRTWLLARLSPHANALDSAVEVVLAPPTAALDRLGRATRGAAVGLAAQNIHAEQAGAFTGETSVAMVEDLRCRYALVGHSERRQLFHETDLDTAAKVARLLESPVRPILCVGETLEEREADRTFEVVHHQVSTVLDRIADSETAASGLTERLVIAYEPVWAIGTGRTATPETAQAVHGAIRAALENRLGEAGTAIRLLYGGSVKPDNAGALLSQADINGALVGGASLDPGTFAEIVFSALP